MSEFHVCKLAAFYRLSQFQLSAFLTRLGVFFSLPPRYTSSSAGLFAFKEGQPPFQVQGRYNAVSAAHVEDGGHRLIIGDGPKICLVHSMINQIKWLADQCDGRYMKYFLLINDLHYS